MTPAHKAMRSVAILFNGASAIWGPYPEWRPLNVSFLVLLGLIGVFSSKGYE